MKYIVLLVILLSLYQLTLSAKKKKSWTSKDIDKIEKDWEEGDDESELIHDIDYNKEVAKKAAPKIDIRQLQKDPLSHLNTASGLVRSAGLIAQVYNIGDNKMIVSVDKSWILGDVVKFLLKRKEIEKLEIDSKTYEAKNYPKLFNDDDDDDL
eukprot:gene20796-26960_t